MRQQGRLTLSTGETFQGNLIGAPAPKSGELVFNTGMVGYSEALTDPSYFGQILIFSYPLIGNYGIPKLLALDETLLPAGFESSKIQVSAVVLSIDSEFAFHWSSFQCLDAWLEQEGTPGLVSVDTRHLVHLIRNHGGVLGRLEPASAAAPALQTHEFFDPAKHNLLPYVSRQEPKIFGRGSVRIGVVDCGLKWNLLRQLIALDCEVQVLPWDADFQSYDCSGWLLSNGPGDPKNTGDLLKRIAKLLDQKKPILGVCLGHQILALAAGAQTERLPYGHRGHNQPVVDLETSRGFMSTQNHGYVVVKDSLPAGWKPWFNNINDNSLEGLKHEALPYRSVQFHPEASGGPQDTGWILKNFVDSVRAHATQT